MMWFAFNHGWGWGGMMFMGIFWVAAIGLIVWVVSRLLNRTNGTVGERRGGAALEIAKERYAKGEISPEEFETIKKVLV